jgi:2-methylcitrate dehydratase PrpD
MAEALTSGSARPDTAAVGTLTEQLARYWSAVRYEDLPDEAIALAKRFLMDTLAAGLAGAGTEVVTAALRAARASCEASGGSAIVWGRHATLPAPLAAMVNGTAAHALELDDFGGCGHSGAVVIPVVAALAGRGGVSGRDALVGLLAGYDLAARVLEGAGGYRPHNDRGWHSTGTCGSFGAAAAAARLLGLDGERFADALGIAGTFTGGIWAFLADGAMTKRFHPGKAAENGLTAALLAQSGMTGPRPILEAEWGGFFSTYSPGIATPEATVAGLGREFRIARSGMKPYSCCRGLHACLDALFELMRETGVDAGGIAGMTVHGNAQVCRQFDRLEIGTMLDAQFSMQYALAVGALSGRATLDQFSPLRADEPEVRRLMRKIEVVADRVLKIGEYPPLEIRLADGRRLERWIPFAKGAPENPLSDREVNDKAVSLITPVLGATLPRAHDGYRSARDDGGLPRACAAADPRGRGQRRRVSGVA